MLCRYIIHVALTLAIDHNMIYLIENSSSKVVSHYPKTIGRALKLEMLIGKEQQTLVMMKEREHNIRDSRSLQNLIAISLRYRQLVIILKAGYEIMATQSRD